MNRHTDFLANLMAGLVLVAIVVGAILIRAYIMGGFNECFWAQDAGLCLAIMRRGP